MALNTVESLPWALLRRQDEGVVWSKLNGFTNNDLGQEHALDSVLMTCVCIPIRIGSILSKVESSSPHTLPREVDSEAILGLPNFLWFRIFGPMPHQTLLRICTREILKLTKRLSVLLPDESVLDSQDSLDSLRRQSLFEVSLNLNPFLTSLSNLGCMDVPKLVETGILGHQLELIGPLSGKVERDQVFNASVYLVGYGFTI